MILSFGFSSIAKDSFIERLLASQGAAFAVLAICIGVAYFFKEKP